MIMQDSYEAACKNSEKAHQIFTQHLLAPSPINYSIIYLYVCHKIPALNKEIDECISNNQLLSSEFIDTLFHKYVNHVDLVEKQVLSPFENSLNSALNKLKSQAISDKTMANNLELAEKALAQKSQSQSVQKVVDFLADSITNSQSQHEKLSQELAHTYQEIHQLKETLKETRKEALLDSLTGLFNRRGCYAKLAEVNLKETHSSLLIDIDHFKNINDTYGHFVGDKVLQRIAKEITLYINDNDIAVRFGGEEFIVVLTNKTKQQAKKIAETIRQAVSKLRLMQRQTQTYLPPISVSIGIAELIQGNTWTDLFERADRALYQAKETGRNRCMIADEKAA